jgi:SAM-dependent methyltransferase
MDDGHERLLEMARGYRPSQVLITCAVLGVFDALAEGGKTASALAEALAVDLAALTRLLNAATALGLLERAGETYANAPATAVCFARGSDGYLGNLLRREAAFYARWSHLAEAVRTGRRPEPSRAMENAHDWVRGFTYALYDWARLAAPAVADALNLADDVPWRVLDVGGGHGGYSIALARRYPHLRATLFDLPSVVEVAREIIGATDVADRISLRAGDFLVDDLGRDYDLALVFGVLVSEPAERRVALLRRVHQALKPGGLLVVREMIANDDGLGPAEALLFDLQMLLSTESGGVLRSSVLMAEICAAGYADVEIRPLSPPGLSAMWLARRP